MSFWWLQPGWTEAKCECGKKIWPEGDPDWGKCFECLTNSLHVGVDHGRDEFHLCDICGKSEAVTSTNKYAVCSEECSDIAYQKESKK